MQKRDRVTFQNEANYVTHRKKNLVETREKLMQS